MRGFAVRDHLPIGLQILLMEFSPRLNQAHLTAGQLTL
jgi:hypothetical protein